jgi:hypothetical protein
VNPTRIPPLVISLLLTGFCGFTDVGRPTARPTRLTGLPARCKSDEERTDVIGISSFSRSSRRAWLPRTSSRNRRRFVRPGRNFRSATRNRQPSVRAFLRNVFSHGYALRVRCWRNTRNQSRSLSLRSDDLRGMSEAFAARSPPPTIHRSRIRIDVTGVTFFPFLALSSSIERDRGNDPRRAVLLTDCFADPSRAKCDANVVHDVTSRLSTYFYSTATSRATSLQTELRRRRRFVEWRTFPERSRKMFAEWLLLHLAGVRR